MVFLAAEIGCATAFVIRRLGRLQEHLEDLQVDDSCEIRREIRRARPDHQRFVWLDTTARRSRHDAMTRANVFITMVVGGGVALSGLAWVLDKIAASTTDPGREKRLADDLRSIEYPTDGILVDDVTVLARRSPRTTDLRAQALLRR